MKTLRSIVVLLAGIFLIAGCGGAGSSGSSDPSDPTNLDGDAAPVTLSLQATSGSLGGALVKALGLETSDDAGSAFDITSAWVNVDKIEIKLPDGVRCADVDFTLSDLATCENEAEDDSDDDAEEDEAEDGDDNDAATLVKAEETGDDEDGDGDDDGEEIEIRGPFIFNLLTGESFPDIGTIEIPSGIVKEIEIKIDDVEEDETLPDGVPADLAGHTLLVEGTFTDGDAATPFSLLLDFDEEVEFENLDGIEVSEVVDINAIIISFDVSSWLSGVDMAACVADGDVEVADDGTVVITEDSSSGDCSDIEDTIKDNIEASGTLDEDDDDDGEEDDDESEDDS